MSDFLIFALCLAALFFLYKYIAAQQRSKKVMKWIVWLDSLQPGDQALVELKNEEFLVEVTVVSQASESFVVTRIAGYPFVVNRYSLYPPEQ